MTQVARPRLPAFFPYIGGKWRIAPKIIALFPVHTCYVEVFGGSGSVLFAKERSHMECLNDIDSEVVNFFRVMSDPELSEALQQRLLFTPYSRELFEELVDMDPPTDPLEKAWRFYTIACQCFGGYRPANEGREFAGATRGRWRRSLSKRHSQGGDAATIHSKISRMDRFSERLRGVYIEKKDFTYIFQSWDSPETLFYCDPPYHGTEGYYDNGHFPATRHVDLANALNAIEGKAILSYYPHADLEQLYPAGTWRRVEVQAMRNSHKTGRGSPKKKVTELLLCNFPEASA